MLEHLGDLMQDAMDYPWHNVRNFHGIVLNHMETARLDWGDDSEIQKLRSVYSQRGSIADLNSSRKTATGNTGNGPVFCLPYQKGACSEAEEHKSAQGKVKHICAYCLKQTGQGLQHPEKDCRRKKEGAKNEQSQE